MVPSDYRLDHVVARLIERLEGQRPTFAARSADALPAFERAARAHVSAAVAEMRATGWTDDPDAHAAFLEREVIETFLPRYHATAARMSEAEARGFGLGPLAEPVGRLGLVAAALLFGWFVLLKLIALPVVWPLLLLTLAAPVTPDISAALHRYHYRVQLQEIVADMGRIQDQERAYLSSGALSAADDAGSVTRPRQVERE